MTRYRNDQLLSADGALATPTKVGPVTELGGDVRQRAVRFVASTATDAADCALLLDALGLEAAEGVRREAAA